MDFKQFAILRHLSRRMCNQLISNEYSISAVNRTDVFSISGQKMAANTDIMRSVDHNISKKRLNCLAKGGWGVR